MKGNKSSWVSLADIMTGLMLVFLLIAILMIHQIVKQQNQVKSAVKEHRNTRSELYSDLNEALKDKKDEWGIEVTEDLIVRFNNPNVLFGRDSASITSRYKDILDQFIPLYLGIITKEKYEDKIREVRIEGHTADFSAEHDSYIDTVELSQDRARNILGYLRSRPFYEGLPSQEKGKLKFWLTANGYGLGRAIDESGSFVYKTGNDISPKSRRAEFSIITNSEKLLKDLNLEI